MQGQHLRTSWSSNRPLHPWLAAHCAGMCHTGSQDDRMSHSTCHNTSSTASQPTRSMTYRLQHDDLLIIQECRAWHKTGNRHVEATNEQWALPASTKSSATPSNPAQYMHLITAPAFQPVAPAQASEQHCASLACPCRTSQQPADRHPQPPQPPPRTLQAISLSTGQFCFHL